MIPHRSLLLSRHNNGEQTRKVTIRTWAIALIQLLRQPCIHYRIALLLALLLVLLLGYTLAQPAHPLAGHLLLGRLL